MSGFGGGGGGFGSSNSGRSSGGRGRSSRSGGRGRGRGRGRGSNDGGGNTSSNYPKPLLTACSNFTKTGTCQHGNGCRYAHIVKLHGIIDASDPIPQQQQQQQQHHNNNNHRYDQKMATVSAAAIWETQGVVKLFSGSHDGFWRLWNFNGSGFVKEFENNMGGPVHTLVVASNFLFCGFESVSQMLPEVNVGMVHAWNLANPTDPPLEFHMAPLIPYAHPQGVTKLLVVDGQNIVSGSKDGSIKLWTFDATQNHGKGGFKLAHSLHGHSREITGLAVADAVLWSSSVDGSIRIWDMANNIGECQYIISMSHAGATPPPTPIQPQQTNSPGHTNAVTSLVSFKSSNGIFILSSSLDGDVKAWNGTTGQCVASESHGEGIVSMSMANDHNGKPFLLLGLESGNIMARNLEPTQKIPQAFALIFTLSHYTAAHSGAVKVLSQGPSGTFYSGGTDGKVLVFQIAGDLGL